ncbi:MAG: DNA mismatch repair protein MutS [Alcaligenaceae bacterium]|nr:DNA mismatch repair protein MutS [Alcaligenaceae bacterium]
MKEPTNKSKEALSPMMKQYWELKSEVPNMLLLFRLGDFYEVFYEDARKTASLLNLTLTSKGFPKDNPIPMAGIPYHSLDQYLPRLVNAGESVAICEQTTSPAESKGLVKREIVRIITPGTLTEDALLPTKENKPLLCIHIHKHQVGLAALTLSNGACTLTECTLEALEAQITRIAPAEIILADKLHHKKQLNLPPEIATTPIHDWYFDLKKAKKDLCEYYQVQHLEGFGIAHMDNALIATGALFQYIKQTQKTLPTHLQAPKADTPHDYLILDPITCQNLELSQSNSYNHQRTLFKQIDHCETGMGSRLLRHWIHHPLRQNATIRTRQIAIQQLVNDTNTRQSLQKLLHQLPDIERISSRISLAHIRPREFVALKHALARLPNIKTLLSDAFKSETQGIMPIVHSLETYPDLVDFLSRSILEEPATLIRDGGVIASGFDSTLDELNALSQNHGAYLRQLEESEKANTGISTLRVEYNRVHGFFIEVSKLSADKVPDHYQRKQTLKNVERYITPELKSLENKILSAQEQALARERTLYNDIIQYCQASVPALIQTAYQLAELDVYFSLAHHATRHQWCCPKLSEESHIIIEQGRHPVVEETIEQFTPNNCDLQSNQRTMIITGPNMGGKSTYMRQVALITLLARMGSFVPATSATIGIIDRIFTRIGAADDLAAGQSTFMMEMLQAAQILQYATPKSLVLMDEIGRGTSTTDGLSLAWAIAEALHTKNQSLTLFATHYFEMTRITEHFPYIQNQHVSAIQSKKGIVFLHALQAGPANQSYGIDVAQLAGIPKHVIYTARQKLIELAEQQQAQQLGLFNTPVISTPTTDISFHESQSLEEDAHEEFSVNDKYQALIQQLHNMDPDQLTPREALDALYELKSMLNTEDAQ